MAGQIIKRGDKTWLVRIFQGRDEKGKRRYVNKTIRGTKRDADKWLTKSLRDRDRKRQGFCVNDRLFVFVGCLAS
jgi:hypothetical protein